MNPLRLLHRAALLVLLAVPAIAAPPSRMPEKPVRFHDPSTPIKQGDTWWIFSTGNGIVTRHSKDLKNWTEGDPVFKTFPAWHQEVVPSQKGHLWAPDIIQRDGLFYLYYSVSGWGKNTSAIGLATNTTLDPTDPLYQWKDRGIVVRSNPGDDFNAIDPQLLADKDGSVWMVFGSFWKGIHLIELDPKTGLRHPKHTGIKQLAWNETIEAAALLKHDGYYYLFADWGLCCRGVNSTYEMRIGRSRKITGPYLDASGSDMATGGGTLFLKSEGDRIGPGHPSFIEENGTTRMFFHYYDGKRFGFATLGDLPIRWSKDGWPEH